MRRQSDRTRSTEPQPESIAVKSLNTAHLQVVFEDIDQSDAVEKPVWERSQAPKIYYRRTPPRGRRKTATPERLSCGRITIEDVVGARNREVEVGYLRHNLCRSCDALKTLAGSQSWAHCTRASKQTALIRPWRQP